MTEVDTLEVPAFLRGPAPENRKKWRAPRWTKLRAQRPEGAKWEEAERWEVTVPGGGKDPHALDWTGTEARRDLAPGRRMVWVIPGRTWTELRDNEGYVKVPTEDWNRVARTGRQVSP